MGEEKKEFDFIASIRELGTSSKGVTIPKEILDFLKLEEGTKVLMTIKSVEEKE